MVKYRRMLVGALASAGMLVSLGSASFVEASSLETTETVAPHTLQPHENLPRDTGSEGAEAENVIADEGLRAMLNMRVFERYEDPEAPVTKDDLAGLEELNLSGDSSIEAWDWITHCVNLKSLDLGNTEFSDARLLTKMSKLAKLTLSATPLEHMEELNSLTNLEVLRLAELREPAEEGEEHGGEHEHEHEHGAEIDLAHINKLDKLKELILLECKLEHPEELAKLTNLEILDVTEADGFQIESLEPLTKLKDLQISATHTSSLKPLADKTQLINLRADQNDITDLSPLSGLNQLVLLDLKANPFTDVSPLKDLIHLESLHINKNSETEDANKIEDISPLATLVNLADLRLDNNKIKDLSALSQLSKLRSLDLAANKLTDISPLKSLANIQALNLSNNQINDPKPLATLIQLQDLRLNNNAIEDIEVLNTLYTGETLFLFGAVDQNVRYTLHSSMPLDKEHRIQLPKGPKITYSLPDESHGASIVDDMLVLPAGFSYPEEYKIGFAAEFTNPAFKYEGTFTVIIDETKPNEGVADSAEPIVSPVEEGQGYPGSRYPESMDAVGDKLAADTQGSEVHLLDKERQMSVQTRVLPKTSDSSRNLTLVLPILLTLSLSSLLGAALLRRRS